MAATTIPCERCGQVVPGESILYSTAGEAVCKACLDAAQTVEMDARAASSQRRGRILLASVIAFVVVVPSAMFATGLGQKMGEALMALGGGLVLGPALMFRVWIRVFRIPLRFAAYMMVSGAVVGGAGYGVHWLAEKYRPEAQAREQREAQLQAALAAQASRAGAQGNQRGADWHALEEEKQRIESEPSKYLGGTDIGVSKSGSVTADTSLDKLTISNSTRFPLWKIQGAVDWMDGDQKVASMVFTVKGALLAGELKELTKDSGVLESEPVQMAGGKPKAKVTRVVVRFTQAVVNE